MTSLMPRRRGKLKREEQSLPVNIRKAFIARANGSNWIESAAIGETTTQNLREWRRHPDADRFIEEAIKFNLAESHSKFADSAPALAQELIDIALDKKTRSYAKVSAIDTAFKILQQGITDKENRNEMAKIRQALDALEGGKPPNVIDVESDG
tara:strand:- start:523 stop:981 length:459 start_codon:yes stop_codon:yes gene_type:complete